MPGGEVRHKEGNAISLVVEPSVHETFIPRELTAAYTELLERRPQYLDAETGITAAAYRIGERVLIVYQESETDVVVLIHPSAWNKNSAKFSFTLTKRPLAATEDRR